MFSAQIAKANQCLMAIEQESKKHEFSYKNLIVAISKIESSLSPYAVNFASKAYFFDSKEEAIDFVQDKLDQGHTNIDIGCMQLNYKYHFNQFDSLEEMFEPKINVSYAIKFLKALYTREQNLRNAVAYYHSSKKEHQKRYTSLVLKQWQQITNK